MFGHSNNIDKRFNDFIKKITLSKDSYKLLYEDTSFLDGEYILYLEKVKKLKKMKYYEKLAWLNIYDMSNDNKIICYNEDVKLEETMNELIVDKRGRIVFIYK